MTLVAKFYTCRATSSVGSRGWRPWSVDGSWLDAAWKIHHLFWYPVEMMDCPARCFRLPEGKSGCLLHSIHSDSSARLHTITEAPNSMGQIHPCYRRSWRILFRSWGTKLCGSCGPHLKMQNCNSCCYTLKRPLKLKSNIKMSLGNMKSSNHLCQHQLFAFSFFGFFGRCTLQDLEVSTKVWRELRYNFSQSVGM